MATENGDVEKQEVPLINGEKTDTDPSKVEAEREGWGNKIEFVLAIIGYAVGLGNLWRFPYILQSNGGGAFIIPYAISLATMGVPLFFLELAIGQRLKKGPLQVWSTVSPAFVGIGFSSVVVSFLVGVYYNMVVAWCLYYLAISFAERPGYADCPMVPKLNATNHTVQVPLHECTLAGSTQYYWYREALDISTSIEESGGLNPYMTAALVVAWILVFGITCKGVESMGKAVYFTAIFPYVALIIFFIQGMTLKGSGAGVAHMFRADWEKLASAQTWKAAATQIFYSLGLGFGGLIAMASYNDINNNILRDAIMVSSINCGTSVFAGIVIFSFLGYKSTMKFEECVSDYRIAANVTTGDGNCTMKHFLDQVAQGPGLTFIAFTEAITTMPVMPLWSVLFFTMLLTLGLGSMIGTFEAVRATACDLKLLPFRKEIVGGILCLASLLIGFLFSQRSGEYWLQMFDSFSSGIGLLTIGILEIIVVVYIYGIKKFLADIDFMLDLSSKGYGKIAMMYFKAMWMVVTPLLTLIIIIFTLYELFANAITYSAWVDASAEVVGRHYPGWGEALCFILIVLSVICIPVFAILRVTGIYTLKLDDEPDVIMSKISPDA